MSGFGGGGFGGGNSNSNNNPFGGGGFGGSSGTPNAPGGFGNFSGAANNTNPFGNSNAFGNSNGSAPAAAPFGGATSSTSFGNTNTGGGGMSFGTSPNVMVAPSGNSGGSGFGGGGGGGGPVGFGRAGTTPASEPRSQQPQHNPFGGSAPPFGGSTSQPQQPSGLTFGASSNVLKTKQGFAGAGASTTGTSSFGGGGSSSGFSQFASSGVSGDKSGWGSSSQTTPSNSKTNASSSNNNPFGGGSSSTSAFGTTNAPPTFSASSTFSSIPENNTMGDNKNNNTNDTTRKNIDVAQAQMEEKKRKLKAKIEEKKRQLLERQQKLRQEEAGRRSKSPTTMSANSAKLDEKKRQLLERQQKQRQEEAGRRSKSPTTMSASAIPSQGMNMNPRNSESKSRTTQQQSLAERNALRFAQHHNQPSVRNQSPVPTTTTSASKEREDLKDAVNLVGLCPAMCPLEELEKRRNESDIQALEVPLPGQLHPADWTLKDTAIKRFRRSAADYKLDVPEWVRPPEVLERTLGYIEEWIMERDRQGPDPRFPNKDIPPPPLDVYQFIWDRTRMIRKDFILQNYVGTGGRCDAKAVRCHERIARWHAMCEHQLSHIDDFVKMQSQQNMQELGQTMKTLNSFYDDALGRSTKEVPDERTGMEKFVPDTNHTANAASDKNKSARGGCLFDTVQGQNPVDYNGNPLNNTPDNPMINQRLIGDNNNKTSARGTAEPEMRGIYMLLTMENEGGMEVLKYAAKLFQERPQVYHSPPVQLALTIFKTIKDMNYVKFFSILRSPSTPYLFSCIMFKQVEVMRRIAMQIMSITYGARNKSTGEAMYDQYPLDRLKHILCFEDMNEAKETCEFYNITVKDYTSQRTGETKEVILWKGSKFRVPKDAEKGHILRLKPRKMMRTIESKLNGATRLAVCRGEVSGKGAALFDDGKPSQLNPRAVSFVPQANPIGAADSEARAQELLMKKKLEEAMRRQQAKEQKEKERRALEKQRILEKQQREEQRRKELREKEQQAAELEKRRRKELEEEKIRRQKRIEEERLRQRKEEELAQKLKEEKARKAAEEAARKQREIEERRKREESERQRRELERRIALEKQKQREEEERRRREKEAQRRELLRRELEAKRKREAEEKRKADEWQSKIDAATKVLMWYRWKRALSRPLEISIRTEKSLQEIDPTNTTDSFHLGRIAEMIMQKNRRGFQPRANKRPTSKDIIEELIQVRSEEAKPKLKIADMALKEIESLSNDFVGHVGSSNSMNLLKIAVICPETMDITDQSYASLIYHWIGTRVNLGKIEIAKGGSNSKFSSTHEVRTLIVKGTSYEVCSSCDIALFVIPSQWSNQGRKAAMLNGIASSLLDENIPRVALALNDGVDGDQIQRTNKVIATELGGSMEAIPIIQPSKISGEAFDSALRSALSRIAKLFIREACVSVIRIPAMQLATKVILSALWECFPSVMGGDVDEDTIVECSRLSLQFLMKELTIHSRRNKIEWSLWPAPEFSSNGDTVESYFAENEGLPLQWTRYLCEDFLQETYQPLLAVFRGHFRDVYQRIVVDAPITVQDDCASECAQGQYRRCLQKALVWMQKDAASSGCFIYLPDGMVDLVVKDVVAKVQANPFSSRTVNSTKNIPILAAAADEAIDNFLLLKKIEYNEGSKGEFEKERDSVDAATSSSSNGSFLPTTKRSRSANHLEHAAKKKRREGEDDTSRMMEMTSSVEKNTNAESNHSQRKKTISASHSYTKKLERLLCGDENIELTVGDSLLSRYLRDVPGPKM